jgi:hypothetical protein
MTGEHDQYMRDPFREFITQSLDLKAIESLDSAAIADEVRSMFAMWMSDNTELSPADYLDEAQEQIRSALAATLVQSSIMQRSELGSVDPGALEWLIRLSVALAFAFETELVDHVDVNEPHPDDDHVDAKRLRRMLMLSMVYARRAALQNDPIACRIVNDAESLLDQTERLR